MKRLLSSISAAAILASTMATAASAHQLWIERDGRGPVRAYLVDMKGDEAPSDENHRIVGRKVFTTDVGNQTPLTKQGNQYVATVQGSGDVRLIEDRLWPSWEEDGQRHAQIQYAKSGRSETTAKLNFEFVPVAPGSDTMVLMFKGKPLANKSLLVFSPKRWMRYVRTDEAGRFTVPNGGPGRYVIECEYKEDLAQVVAGEQVARVNHVTTLSFIR